MIKEWLIQEHNLEFEKDSNYFSHSIDEKTFYFVGDTNSSMESEILERDLSRKYYKRYLESIIYSFYEKRKNENDFFTKYLKNPIKICQEIFTENISEVCNISDNLQENLYKIEFLKNKQELFYKTIHSVVYTNNSNEKGDIMLQKWICFIQEKIAFIKGFIVRKKDKKTNSSKRSISENVVHEYSTAGAKSNHVYILFFFLKPKESDIKIDQIDTGNEKTLIETIKDVITKDYVKSAGKNVISEDYFNKHFKQIGFEKNKIINFDNRSDNNIRYFYWVFKGDKSKQDKFELTTASSSFREAIKDAEFIGGAYLSTDFIDKLP